jgi:hypothetical protein
VKHGLVLLIPDYAISSLATRGQTISSHNTTLCCLAALVCYVLLLGDGVFDNLVESIEEKITNHRTAARIYDVRITKEANIEKREEMQRLLDRTNSTMGVLKEFLHDVKNEWKEPS